MRIALFGATGRVGREIMRLMITGEHEISALVRNPARLPFHRGLKVVEGNVLRKDDVFRTLEGCGAVVSTLNTDGGTTLSESMPYIIEGMKENGIKRIVTIGTAGILQARENPALYRYESSESRQSSTRAAAEHRKVYEALRDSELDWTIVCPTYLIDGAATFVYRTEEEVLPLQGTKISTCDTAHFAYQVLLSSSFSCVRIGIAY